MSFSYYNKDNNIKRLNIEIGKEWNSYKENYENSLLNSIFIAVDENSDGKVDKKELDILQKLLKLADSQIDQSKNNNIIEKEELELLNNKIQTRKLETLKGNEATIESIDRIINIPSKNKYSNIQILSAYTYEDGEAEDGSQDIIKIGSYTIDVSSLNNLPKGVYYIESWNYDINDDSSETYSPIFRTIEIESTKQDGTKNWSEGINRHITKIELSKPRTNLHLKIIDFLNKVGEEQGFTVNLLDCAPDSWIEDFSIVRSDKKQVIPKHPFVIPEDRNNITTKRNHITSNTQGNILITKTDSTQVSGESDVAIYTHILSEKDIIWGKTYLEGGNVLNTLNKNGEPAAVIGEESLKYTMLAMHFGFENLNNEENINKAKKQIANELGLKEENITYIPQFDFHIDMYYRPLNNGQMAVPDYEMGINVLREFIQDIDKKLESNSENSNSLLVKKEEYNKLIIKLKNIKDKTAEISQEAENELKRQGYEIVKIPCFSNIDNGCKKSEKSPVENSINYMNGICGTSAKTDNKFYITNTSGDENIDNYMEKYFKEVVGFDKVYFAPTKKHLEALGGIDCLTKEF